MSLTQQEAETIVAIAARAAAADGNQSDAERSNIAQAAQRLGLSLNDTRLTSGIDVALLTKALTSDEARLAAYDTATAVCSVDGPPNAAETAFLTTLSQALGAVPGMAESAAAAGAAAAAASTPGGAAAGDLDQYILDQAMLTAACELLPHRLSSLGILPLQLRMAYSIGQRHGHAFGMDQAKDLAGVLGIGAAGHFMEGIVRGVVGKVAGGLLGGLLGKASGAASGVAVTFATTYALGHAANQYYAQGRKLSTADLKALFTRLQGEASTMYPKIEGRIREVASGTNLNSILAGVVGR